MKKPILLTVILVLITFTGASAENWKEVGLWGPAKVEVDTDSIRLVTPPNSSMALRYCYQFKIKLSGKNYELIQTQVVDLRRNYTLLQSQEKNGGIPEDFLKTFRGTELNKWTPNSYGLTFPTIYGYIYSNQDMIHDRTPYTLQESEKQVFSNTTYTSPGMQWKPSFERERLNGWILTTSVQLEEVVPGVIPAIRFMGSTSYDEAVSKVDYLFLLEANIEPPNQHKLYYQWESSGAGRRSTKWELFVNRSTPQPKALDNKSDLAYLTATAYVYMLTNPEVATKTPFFIPGEAGGPADKWLKLAN